MLERIRVLVVDDSAFVRKVLADVLRKSPSIEVVGTARDGYDALAKIEALKPDVVTLDLMMPELNGVDLIKALPAELSPRVVVVTVSAEHSELALAALEAGAIDVIRKPTALATDQLYELGDELLRKVQAAYQARRPQRSAPMMEPLVLRAPPASTEILVIGTSTGGPPALTELLRVMPQDLPVPVAIVCHMPIGFTKGLAARLNAVSKLEVHEASEGFLFGPGMAVIAQAGYHLLIERSEKSGLCRLEKPNGNRYQPSVDILFESAARAFGRHVLGCVLTGMGDDGLVGARAIHAAGGRILTEAKSSCVVHGMPRCVLEAGLSDADVPRERMAAEIVRRL